MIVNFNVTGKETFEELCTIAENAAQDFVDELHGEKDFKIVSNTMAVYSLLSSNMMSWLLTQRTINESRGDIPTAKSLARVHFADLTLEILSRADSFLDQTEGAPRTALKGAQQ